MYIPTNTCPNCGYCPHCGRGGHQAQPFYPAQPYVIYQSPLSGAHDGYNAFTGLGGNNAGMIGNAQGFGGLTGAGTFTINTTT